MTTKTPEELELLRAQGPAAVDAYKQGEERAVFGHDLKRDRKGKPVEQGIGSRGNETANHFAALRKREIEGHEPEGAHEAALAEMWKRDPERAEALGLPQPKKAAA